MDTGFNLPSCLAAVAALGIALVVPSGSVWAGETSSVLEVKSDSDDAAKLVRRILDEEEARLEACGEDFVERNPGDSAKVSLRIDLSAKGGTVHSMSAADAERREVACLGKKLAGVSWPKASQKVSVTVKIGLNVEGRR